MIRTLPILLAMLISACQPQTEAQAQATPAAQDAAHPRHPVSGLEVIPLTITSGETVHRFSVELADTPEAQQKGLMFRTELGPNEGMIFPTGQPAIRSFWMKNTPLPLDIIFIGTDGRILNIAAETTPYSLDSIYSAGLTTGVLELRGGRAAQLGIKRGDLVKW